MKISKEAIQKASFFMSTLRQAQCDMLVINLLSYWAHRTILLRSKNMNNQNSFWTPFFVG